MTDQTRIDELIENSSLGTPAAKRLRARTSEATAGAIVAAAKQDELDELTKLAYERGDSGELRRLADASSSAKALVDQLLSLDELIRHGGAELPLTYIARAYVFIKETVADGGSILFVGTQKQAQEAIAIQAQRVDMPYVNRRWLSGTLTNFQTVQQRRRRLRTLEARERTSDFKGLTKREILIRRREKDRLALTLGGIRDMHSIPSAVWVVDTKKDQVAVGEARKLGIPVVAILDPNGDPDEVDYAIPGNDDTILFANVLTRIIADAAAAGLMARAARSDSGEVTWVQVEGPFDEREWMELMRRGDDRAAASLRGEDGGTRSPQPESGGGLRTDPS
jgi:small subunit ribosomal protein S2